MIINQLLHNMCFVTQGLGGTVQVFPLDIRIRIQHVKLDSDFFFQFNNALRQ